MAPVVGFSPRINEPCSSNKLPCFQKGLRSSELDSVCHKRLSCHPVSGGCLLAVTGLFEEFFEAGKILLPVAEIIKLADAFPAVFLLIEEVFVG